MAWNQQPRKTPEEALTTNPNWGKRGLNFWVKKLATAEARLRTAGSSAAIGRQLYNKRQAAYAIHLMTRREHCPTCGAEVDSIFDHIDIDCANP